MYAAKIRKFMHIGLALAVLSAGVLTGCSSKQDSTAPVSETLSSAEMVSEQPGSAAGTTVSTEPLNFAGGEHTYTIVYDNEFSKRVKSACEELNEHLGGGLTVVADENNKGEVLEESEYEIILGADKRPECLPLVQDLGLFDYRIEIEGEKLIIAGGSQAAYLNAIAELIRSEEFAEGSLERDYSVYFDGADNRDEYIADPDKFLCTWVLTFEVPDWMLDIEEKMASFADPNGRMMSSIHRGDSYNYPENSIEGIISAMKMGADNIEVDIRVSKDGVPVLMHDETLNQTTDWHEKAGKNGLPESKYLKDWTFAELRELRLNASIGDDYEYLIPTLEEVLQVCKERTTIRLDKFSVWDWDTDIYPLIQKTGAWRTCILSEFHSTEKQEEIMSTIKAESGMDVLRFYTLKHEKASEWVDLTNSILEKDGHAIAIWRNPNIKQLDLYAAEAEPYLSQVKESNRMFFFTHKQYGGKEVPEEWDKLYEYGVDFVIADYALDVQQYIAENYEPAK